MEVKSYSYIQFFGFFLDTEEVLASTSLVVFTREEKDGFFSQLSC